MRAYISIVTFVMSYFNFYKLNKIMCWLQIKEQNINQCTAQAYNFKFYLNVN